jgi:hypothetical protein
VLTVCFSGCVGGMLSGQMISLKDGEIYPFEIQTSSDFLIPTVKYCIFSENDLAQY